MRAVRTSGVPTTVVSCNTDTLVTPAEIVDVRAIHQDPGRRRRPDVDTDLPLVYKESMASRTISPLIATCFCLLLVGCGGNSEKQSTGVGDAFATKAVAACKAALADKQRWQPFPVANFNPSEPDPAAFPSVSAWLAKDVAPTFHMWLSALQALGQPPSAQNDWDAMLAVVRKIDQLNRDQITAANARDSAAFASATTALGSAQDDLVATSEKAGVPDCADVHAA